MLSAHRSSGLGGFKHVESVVSNGCWRGAACSSFAARRRWRLSRDRCARDLSACRPKALQAMPLQSPDAPAITRDREVIQTCCAIDCPESGSGPGRQESDLAPFLGELQQVNRLVNFQVSAKARSLVLLCDV
jgi:hypothetical protein